MCGRPDIDETIRRLCALADAGADCLFAPRIDTAEQVAAIVAAVSSKPVNVLIDALSVTVAELRPGSATDQCRGNPGADGMGWLPPGSTGDHRVRIVLQVRDAAER